MSVGAVNKQTGDRIPTAGMPAIDDALDLTSVNPVQNAIITAALADKQDKTDNNLETTAKTIVGAINEHEGDISSLMSGLTNLDIDMNVPDRKNILPCSLTDIKRMNTQGTWDGSVYTYNGVTFTVNTNGTGYVTSIVVTGQSTGNSNIMLVNNSTPNVHLELNGKRVTYSGCPAGGSENTYNLYGWKVTSSASGVRDTGDGVTFDAINMDSSFNFALIIGANYELPSGGLTFYPMLRLASVADPTFAPYIPSVESRIEAVESGVTNINTELNGKRIRYDGGTAWPGTSLEFTVSKGNDFAYHFVAIASTASDTTSQSGYLVIRNDNTVLIVDQIGSFTASYNGTTGVLTITLPSSGYWDYRFERVASRLG